MKFPQEIEFIANAFRKQRKSNVRLEGKRAIVSGSTSGVGYHTARRLAQGGAKLTLVARNEAKAIKVRDELLEFGGVVDYVIADFSQMSSVRTAAAEILERDAPIDILINSAGVFRTVREETSEGFDLVFAVNHLAIFLFTRLLLERIVQSAPARILQVNSQGHRFGGLKLDDLHWENRFYNGYQSYGAAKVAQLLSVWEFAERLEGTGVTINAVHPGAVRTNIGMDNGFLYRFYQRHLLWPLLGRADQSGEALYYMAASPEMETVSGKYFNRTIEERPMPHAISPQLGKEVWNISEGLTGLPPMAPLQ